MVIKEKASRYSYSRKKSFDLPRDVENTGGDKLSFRYKIFCFEMPLIRVKGLWLSETQQN